MSLNFKDEKALVSFVIEEKLPAWQVKLFKRNADAVQVHSQGQIFFKIDKLFPNEQAESKEHRVLAFESVTEASFCRAANNINRIFKNSSYSFEASDKTIEIANSHVFDGKNLFSWFLDEWTSWALKEDPNARIVVYPPEYVKTGKAQVVFVASDKIKRLDEETIVFISEAESEVTYDLEEVRIKSDVFYDQAIKQMNVRNLTENTYTPKIVTKIVRPVYHAFFKGVGFYRIEQLKSGGKEYQIDFFPIKEDFIPVIDVGGERATKKVCKSFLSPFVPFGNLALLQHSQHTAVNFTFSFPRMSEVQTPCDVPNCLSGWIETEDANYPDGKKKCVKCGGSGYLSNQTPYKIYRKVYDAQAMDGDDKALTVPDVQFYTPDVSILDYSKKEWKDYLEMAERAVYVQQQIQTGNIPAAKSKEIDRDDLYAFLSRVAQVYFSRVRFVLQCLENYNVASPVFVTIQIPFSFAILSENEAFLSLKDILSSGVPIMLKANQVESFINKFVSQSSPIRKFIDVLKIVDPLLYYNTADISSYKLTGAITDEQISVHVFSYQVLQKLYFNDKNLFLQDTNTIINKVLAELKAYKPAPVVDLKTKLLTANA